MEKKTSITVTPHQISTVAIYKDSVPPHLYEEYEQLPNGTKVLATDKECEYIYFFTIPAVK